MLKYGGNSIFLTVYGLTKKVCPIWLFFITFVFVGRSSLSARVTYWWSRLWRRHTVRDGRYDGETSSRGRCSVHWNVKHAPNWYRCYWYQSKQVSLITLVSTAPLRSFRNCCPTFDDLKFHNFSLLRLFFLKILWTLCFRSLYNFSKLKACFDIDFFSTVALWQF